MDRNEKIAHISKLPLFSELSPEEIALIEPSFYEDTFLAGEYVYRQREYSFALYLFISGEGRLLRVDNDGIERKIADVDPGEFVGEKSLFLHDPRPESLVIVRDATVLYISRRNFDDFIRRNPRIKSRLNVRDDVRIEAQDIDFPWLERGEIVLEYTHRHKWAFFRRALLALPMAGVLMPLPLVILPLVISMLPGLPLVLIPLGFIPVIVVPLLFIVYAYFDWQNDWFVVTNKHVVHEEAVLLTFQESRQQAPLASIQSVQTVQRGYFAERFGFGDLLIATAGAGGTLTWDTIDDPEALAAILKSQLRSTGADRAAEDRQRIRSEIDRFLGRSTLSRSRADDIPQPGQQLRPPEPPKSVQSALQQRLEKINDYFDIRTRFEETGRITYRKHWLVLWNGIFTPVFFFILTLIALVIALVAGNTWPWNMVQPLVLVLVFIVLFVAEALWFWYMYEDWHNDLYVVEDQTVTRIHRRPLWLQDDQSTILIKNIQGVNVSIGGIWQKALNYGTVTIQTAADDTNLADGTGGETRIPYIYRPHDLQEDILRRQRGEREDRQENEQDRMAEQIARWLAVYHQATNPDAFDAQSTSHIDKGRLRGDIYRSEGS